MKIISLQFHHNARPLLNASYIDTRTANFREWDLELSGDTVLIRCPRGSYIVPLQSCSWVQIEHLDYESNDDIFETLKQPKKPVRKARRSAKKATAKVPAS